MIQIKTSSDYSRYLKITTENKQLQDIPTTELATFITTSGALVKGPPDLLGPWACLRIQPYLSSMLRPRRRRNRSCYSGLFLEAVNTLLVHVKQQAKSRFITVGESTNRNKCTLGEFLAFLLCWHINSGKGREREQHVTLSGPFQDKVTQKSNKSGQSASSEMVCSRYSSAQGQWVSSVPPVLNKGHDALLHLHHADGAACCVSPYMGSGLRMQINYA